MDAPVGRFPVVRTSGAPAPTASAATSSQGLAPFPSDGTEGEGNTPGYAGAFAGWAWPVGAPLFETQDSWHDGATADAFATEIDSNGSEDLLPRTFGRFANFTFIQTTPSAPAAIRTEPPGRSNSGPSTFAR